MEVKMVEQVKWFADRCVEVFGENLVCVLLLGSSQRQDTTSFSDLDSVIVLKTHNIFQVALIRERVRSSLVLFDCSILCQDELPKNSDEFHLGTHGCYHLELVLKKAECLWGTNVLLQLPSPSPRAIRDSLIRKLEEYAWWIRRMFVESNRDRSLADNYKTNSRIIKMVRDCMLLAGHEGSATDPVSDVMRSFVNLYGSNLTETESKCLVEMSDQMMANANTANMSEEYFLIRYSIANKLYKSVSTFR